MSDHSKLSSESASSSEVSTKINGVTLLGFLYGVATQRCPLVNKSEDENLKPNEYTCNT